MTDVAVYIAFRDGGVGPGANRRKPTDETARGGRGGRGARARGGKIALMSWIYWVRPMLTRTS